MLCPNQGNASWPGLLVVLAVGATLLVVNSSGAMGAKDFLQKERPEKGTPCIARFESTTGQPLYYTCPRPNDSEKKTLCCYLDKCCDQKEYQKQTEKQYKFTQSLNNGHVIDSKHIGSALKILFWMVALVILFIVGCCCVTFFLCKKKLFKGGIFSTPLPAQPPGPSPYAPPTNPYMAYQWPPETAPAPGQAPPPPPAYPQPSYPPYPSANGGMQQQPFNPHFK